MVTKRRLRKSGSKRSGSKRYTKSKRSGRRSGRRSGSRRSGRRSTRRISVGGSQKYNPENLWGVNNPSETVYKDLSKLDKSSPYFESKAEKIIKDHLNYVVDREVGKMGFSGFGSNEKAIARLHGQGPEKPQFFKAVLHEWMAQQ